MSLIQNIFGPTQTSMQKGFAKYHAENPNIYAAYYRFAMELHKAGVKKKSISMITERIRWETTVGGNGEYKIQNTFRAGYARLLMWKHPALKGSFSIKSSDLDGFHYMDLHDLSTWNASYWNSL